MTSLFPRREAPNMKPVMQMQASTENNKIVCVLRVCVCGLLFDHIFFSFGCFWERCNTCSILSKTSISLLSNCPSLIHSSLFHSLHPHLPSVPVYLKGLQGQLACFTAAPVLLAREQHYKHWLTHIHMSKGNCSRSEFLLVCQNVTAATNTVGVLDHKKENKTR